MSILFKLNKNRIEQLSVSDFLQLAHKLKIIIGIFKQKYMYLTLKKTNNLSLLLDKLFLN